MKVLLILSDGMRPDGLDAHPAAARLMREGSYTLRARTVMPSVTLPCHMSLFHSVDPGRHGILTNTYVPQVRPVTGLFECLHANGNTTAMLYDWEELRDLARPGALAKSLFLSGGTYGYEQTGAQLCETAKAWLSGGGIDFAFLYLGWPDAAGHTYGWLSDEYFRAVNATCDRVGEVVDCLGDEYTIILTADHGGHDRCHGFDCPEDMTIPAFFRGKPFEAGRELQGVSIKDIAPTVAALLGAAAPEEWEGTAVRWSD